RVSAASPNWAPASAGEAKKETEGPPQRDLVHVFRQARQAQEQGVELIVILADVAARVTPAPDDLHRERIDLVELLPEGRRQIEIAYSRCIVDDRSEDRRRFVPGEDLVHHDGKRPCFNRLRPRLRL